MEGSKLVIDQATSDGKIHKTTWEIIDDVYYKVYGMRSFTLQWCHMLWRLKSKANRLLVQQPFLVNNEGIKAPQ